MVNRSLVIGKFYPPHRGHRYLIDTAVRQSTSTTVLVCDAPGQFISAQQRATWIRELHPTADVRVIPDIGHDDDSQLWADYTRQFLGWAPDAVFSSEDYGPVYASLMGSRHVMVDRERTTVPISGTQVRENPLAAWPYLEACVRAYFTKRICILGAESTGTTTLSRALAEFYQTVWVPEFGRTYSEEKMVRDPNEAWTSDEFVYIAREQQAQEDEAARRANKLLICDTNAFATGLWHERYMHSRSKVVERIGRQHRPDLYILTGDEIPFVQDGFRDGEHIRHWMHGLFEQRLREQPVPWIVVRGTRQQRLAQAKQAIEALEKRSPT